MSGTYDVIVIGGSYAGIAASLQLARARRSVLIIDAGVRRNRFATAAHGVLGHDGRPPAAIVSDGRTQLLAYPTVHWLDATATAGMAVDGGYAITAAGADYVGTRIVLAIGVTDELLNIPGLRERWGTHVFHCPYCHGYELNRGSLGVLATGPGSAHQALLVAEWGETTLLTNGQFEPDEELQAHLAARGIRIERQPILSLGGPNADVHLQDGSTIRLDGLFMATRTRLSSSLPSQLGCDLEEGPNGAFVRTDPMQATSVPGIYACGDAARAMGSISFAIGDGAQAGMAVHRSLIMAPDSRQSPDTHPHDNSTSVPANA